MDRLHTVLNRGRSTWDRALVPAEEFRGRLQAVREIMREERLDLLLVYGDSASFGHLAYLTHFIPKNRGALAAIPLAGEPALVVQEPSRNNPFSKTLTWVEEVHSVGELASGVETALRARGLAPKRLGLAGVEEQLPIREWEKISAVLGSAELRNVTASLARLRWQKSAAEERALRRAAALLSASLEALRGAIRAGAREYEVTAVADREARRRGAEDCALLVARSSTPEIGLRPAGGARLESGEVLLVSAAASYQRYWVELGRGFPIGAVPEAAREACARAERIHRRLRETLRAGLTCAEAVNWLDEIPSPSLRSLVEYGLGNGIGLDLFEEPFVAAGDQTRLAAGMFLTLRACFTGADCGAALVAAPYKITPAGLEPLVEYP
jgi:Xaa-Pro aminopeptidase